MHLPDYIVNPITGIHLPTPTTGQGGTQPFTPLTNEINLTPETNEVFVENGNNLIPLKPAFLIAALLIIGILNKWIKLKLLKG